MKSIIALYDDIARARAVESELKKEKLGTDRIEVVSEELRSPDRHTTRSGLVEHLKALGASDDDAHAYAEGVRRGAALVTTVVDDQRADEALDLMRGYAPLDVGRRRQGWSGFTRHDEAAPALSEEEMRAERERWRAEEKIPLLEETLKVGKRAVSGGTMHLRTYVVERPVQETVRLREETVDVQRRAVDRPAAAGEAGFQERVVDVPTYREEPVVEKSAHVREEVVVKKGTAEREERVQDTVRRTEVDVDDEARRTPR